MLWISENSLGGGRLGWPCPSCPLFPRRWLLPTSSPVLPHGSRWIRLDRRSCWLESLVSHPHPALCGETDEAHSRWAQGLASLRLRILVPRMSITKLWVIAEGESTDVVSNIAKSVHPFLFVWSFLGLFCFLAIPGGWWNLSSLTRDQTQALAVKAQHPNHWWPLKSQSLVTLITFSYF